MAINMHFAGSPLNRSSAAKKDESFLKELLNGRNSRIVIVAGSRGKKVLCSNLEEQQELREDGKSSFCLETFFTQEVLGALNTDVDNLVSNHTVVLLGHFDETDEWYIAVDVIDLDLQRITKSIMRSKRLQFLDGRQMLVSLCQVDLAIAGHAAAVCSWHVGNQFDGWAGKSTRSIECGAKRATTTSTSVKIYPRIDPVVIVAVFSPDKSQLLLGNMKHMPSNFYSCLSGFVEPCESVQEAAAREVWEESGVVLDRTSIQLVETQPWPIGRGGGCELMLGCNAQAISTTICIHDETVNDVRWFSLAEIEQLLRSAHTDGYQSMSYRQSQGSPFIPGDYALAFHLISNCANAMSQVVSTNSESKPISGMEGYTLKPPHFAFHGTVTALFFVLSLIRDWNR